MCACAHMCMDACVRIEVSAGVHIYTSFYSCFYLMCIYICVSVYAYVSRLCYSKSSRFSLFFLYFYFIASLLEQVFIGPYADTCMYMFPYIYMHICVHIYTCIHIHAYMSLCVHIHTQIHIHIHAHTPAYNVEVVREYQFIRPDLVTTKEPRRPVYFAC